MAYSDQLFCLMLFYVACCWNLWDSVNIYGERKKGDVRDLEILLIQLQCRTDPRGCIAVLFLTLSKRHTVLQLRNAE